MSEEWAKFPDAGYAPPGARQWNVSPIAVRFFF
ncbi:hypothetical protein BPC006_II0854 [Burkholderia pseudomallei BPC006]|nr:hypothetical protein BPC006_II0854 [Burkholderia pseudomallei BPC006]